MLVGKYHHVTGRVFLHKIQRKKHNNDSTKILKTDPGVSNKCAESYKLNKKKLRQIDG